MLEEMLARIFIGVMVFMAAIIAFAFIVVLMSHNPIICSLFLGVEVIFLKWCFSE